MGSPFNPEVEGSEFRPDLIFTKNRYKFFIRIDGKTKLNILIKGQYNKYDQNRLTVKLLSILLFSFLIFVVILLTFQKILYISVLPLIFYGLFVYYKKIEEIKNLKIVYTSQILLGSEQTMQNSDIITIQGVRFFVEVHTTDIARFGKLILNDKDFVKSESYFNFNEIFGESESTVYSIPALITQKNEIKPIFPLEFFIGGAESVVETMSSFWNLLYEQLSIQEYGGYMIINKNIVISEPFRFDKWE